jgi:hypothetical protein
MKMSTSEIKPEKKRQNAEGQARHREAQKKLGRRGRLIYLTEDEFSRVKRLIEDMRASKCNGD